MIALRDNMPLIELSNGHSVAFERQWLVRSLTRAATKAGYAQWWLAEHVAQSVVEYLQTQSEWNVLPVDRLNRAVKSALEVIGYAEVARHFEPGRPCVRVSLVDVAREAGAGYELAFFVRLRRLILELVLERTCDFELLGLDTCVKLLKSRKIWSRDCESLRAEIIDFARSQTEQAAGTNEVSFSLA